MANPQIVLDCPLKPKTRLQKVHCCLEMLRSFPRLDESSIRCDGFKNLRSLLLFDRFHFARSFEYVREFQCTSNPKRFWIAAIINRTLHLYDYIHGDCLFQMNLPNAIQRSSTDQNKKLFFIDDDRLLVVQDSQSRLTLVCMQTQI